MTNMDSAETTPDSKFKNLIEANNVSGILKLLEPSEKKNIDNACNVFSALTATIIKILAKCPQYVNVAEQGCRQIMNSHMEAIHSMMSSHSKPKHKKAVLKLLTAIVSLGKTFPRELLNHLTLHPLLVDALASHNKPTDPENVRTCFIHFLLSFIIEGNSSTIKALLDKRGVLSSIFADLIYDSCEIVQLVLKTLKKYILENSSITKTIKIHLFNTSAIESLVNLYNWKGPKNWQGFKKTDKILEPVDVEEKNMTLNALHELLITLMTSTRYGIVFHDHSLGTDSGRKHNHFIDVILQSLERPWEHEKPSELVVEILASCPDLISSQFISMEPYLEPRVSAKWATALQFIGKIIDNIDIEKCLKSCLEKMSYLKFTEALLNLIMPPTVIKNAVVPSLENENTCIHYKTIQIMYTMMKKVESFLKFMENSEVNVEDFKNVKMITDEHVKNNVPAFDNLANAWMKAFSQNLETDNSELNESEEDITKLKVKAFSILVHLNPSGFSASMDIFGMVLTFLLTNIGCSDVSLDSDIRITLNLLINSSGIFDGFDGLDIWIDSISKFENKIEKTELAEWLAKLVKRVCKNTDKYKQLPCLEDRMDVDDDSVDQENPNDLQNNMLPFISISPLLNAAIQSLEKHSTTSESLYMSHVLMHTLHCQVSPTTLILLLKNVDIPALSYIKSWLEGETPLVISEPFAKNTVFSMMSEILLSADQPALVDDNNFGSNNNELSVELKKKRHTYALTRFEMKYLLKLVIFYAVQNMKQSNGHLKKLELFKKIVSSILKMGKALQEDSDGFLKECASWFFKNPVILKYFHGLSKKKTASTSDGTIFFKSICQMFFDMNKQEMIAPLMVPYQNKFVENFKSFISKQREDKLKKDLHYSENIIDILQINVERAKEFVDEIMSITCEKFLTSDKFNLSVWGIMLPEFMNRILKFKLTTQSIAIESGTIGKILLCMTELLKFDAELTSWVTAIRDLFLKYPQQLTTIDENIFMALLTSKKIASIKEIFALVIFENSMCMDLFMKFIKNNEDFYQQQDVLFYILSKNVDQKWKKKFISTLFNLYKNDIVTYVTTLKTNNKCLENNIGAIGYFIDNCFDPEECKKMCDGILLNAEVLDHAQEIHIQVLKKLFIKSLPVYPDALKSLVQVFLRITLIVLKKEPKNTSKLNNICQSLIEAIADLKTKASVSHFEDLSKNHSWPLFTRICLKVGLKNSKKTETEKLLVLKALLVTCDLAYEDDCKEEYVKTIFEMTTSHSEFVNTMLSNNSNLKDDLIELLYILTKKNNTTMAETQVSLYLASYGATLSRSDQLILQILFNFEKNGLEFSKYQPFLWGEAAATHYSVKGGADTILFRQTSTSEVFDLLQSDIVSNTIKNFPVHRNSLTEVMEIDSGDKIYDPQFYLSLFQQLLEPNNVVPCHKVIHSGAFALAIAACSSTCSLIRGKALSVISKYCFHIEATSSKEKELWLNFIQVLRNGIIESGVPIKELRLNGFVSTFLAKASLVMRSPTDKLYKPIQSFLMAKPVLDINSIPEFITLFNSSDIDYKAHRHWILGIVRDGLKTDEDMNIAFRKMVFHTLFMFYNSILCDKMSKVLILQIMKSATKLPKGCLILVKSYCLTSWLITAGKKLGNTDNEARRCLTDIIKNIFHACSVKNYEPKFSLLTLKELEKLL